MPSPLSLRCRACGAASVVEPDSTQACAACWGPLELVVDVTGARPADGERSMWRWADLLPAAGDVTGGLVVGGTPLVPAPRLGSALGIDDLWVKDETRNPTGSFKDRLVALALARARHTGATVAACATTGNLGRSVAALAARAGMAAVVLAPAALGDDRLAQLAALGATVLAVDAPYDRLNRLSGELAGERPDWAWVNVGLRAWYVHGARTIAYEVAEDLGWTPPDHVVVPMASGGTALAVHQGFADLDRAGLSVGRPPALSVPQPAGSAAVAAAFAAGADDVDPVRAVTVAGSLAMGDPPDAADVLAAIRGTGGGAPVVAEDDIGPAQALLARTEGIVGEPAAGVVVAGLGALVAGGTIRPGQRVVAVVTGSGRDEPGPLLASAVGPIVTGPKVTEVLSALEAAGL